jgi:hypothetical protein
VRRVSTSGFVHAAEPRDLALDLGKLLRELSRQLLAHLSQGVGQRVDEHVARTARAFEPIQTAAVFGYLLGPPILRPRGGVIFPLPLLQQSVDLDARPGGVELLLAALLDSCADHRQVSRQ